MTRTGFALLPLAGVLIILTLQTACKGKEEEEEPDIYGSWIDPHDGTVYRTIELGEQTWLADNLNVGEMVDGTQNQEDNGIIEKYCYDNNPVFCEKYGGLYQWDEAMKYGTNESERGICPEGWHIPSDNEWKILEEFLGMNHSETADMFWRGFDQGASLQQGGESGFDALRAGNRFITGSFSQLGKNGYFWSSTLTEDDLAMRRGISIDNNGIYRSENDKLYGFSVRCVKY
jgi:uncharacterized protein (TIGR02145 family)